MHANTRRPRNLLLSFAALALLALPAFAVSGCTTGSPADTWVQPNQNSANTRYAGGRIQQGTINSLAVGWTADQRTRAGVGSEAPSPLITSRNVFVQAPAGNWVAFNLLTGENTAGQQSPQIATRLPSWLLSGGKGRLRSLVAPISPLLAATGKDDKHVAVGASGDRLVALDGESGAKSWNTTLKAEKGSVPRVISNMAAGRHKVFVPVADVNKTQADGNLTSIVSALQKKAASKGRIVALNANNGKVAWTTKLSSVPLGAATLVNDVVFTSTLDGNVYGLNAGNGKVIWSSPLPAGAVAPIAAYNGTLIVPAGLVTRKGQKAQVVAFTIGGLGTIGGPAAPKIKQQAKAETAEKSAGSESAGPAAAGPDGKDLFTQNCAGCHVLKDAGTSGTAGPDLDTLKPSASVVDKQVTDGGPGMPAFKGTLSPEEIKAIADYVSSVAGK